MRRNIVQLVLRFLVIVGAWTLYALFAASQNYLSRAYTTRVDWYPAFKYAALDAYCWALLTPLVLLTGRLTMRRNNWWWTLPAQVSIAVALAFAHLTLVLRLLPLLGYQSPPRILPSMVAARLPSDLLTAVVLLGIRQAIEYYRQYRSRELTVSQLEMRLVQSQLEVLRMQIQPHFLFNTLHSISTLMYKDVENADRMMTRLSDFLRLTLASAGVHEVTLKRELEFMDTYLEIEHVRLGDRLVVRRDVQPDTLDLVVPTMILQPLLENAVRHSIAPRANGGTIEISARRRDSVLKIEISDDGPGVSNGDFHEGVGLSNIRARMEQLYGDAQRMQLGRAVHGGFCVTLTLPAHAAEIDASSDR